MTLVTVEITNEQQLAELAKFLNNRGLKFELEDEDWGDLSVAEVEAVKAGIDDFKHGRVVHHADAMAQIENPLCEFATSHPYACCG